MYSYLYLNMEIFVFVLFFEDLPDKIFVFVFDWHIWVYLRKYFFQIHFSFSHFDTTEIDNPPKFL